MTTKHRPSVVVGLLAAGALALAACGGSDSTSTAGAEAAPAAPAASVVEPAPVAAPTTDIAVTSGTGVLGDILVGDGGLTVYGFTNDTEARSTCYGACAEAWPPVLVDADWNVSPDLDLGIFATTERDDGTLQLVAGKWPLYYFAGDAVPGDVNGQGSGDVWFAVDLDGILIDSPAGDVATAEAEAAPAEAAPIVVAAETSLGEALVDADGLTLYGFLEDVDAIPTCDDACADAWPPVLLDSAGLPADLDPAVFSVAERADGSFQLVAGIWPLYRFAGDAAPGDVNGQSSGDVWFVATPTGGLIRPDAEAQAAPAADVEADAPVEDEDSSGY